MNCAKDIQGSFEAWMGENGRTLGGLDFSLNVLTQGFWPPYKEENMRLPGPLQRCKETFSECEWYIGERWSVLVRRQNGALGRLRERQRERDLHRS